MNYGETRERLPELALREIDYEAEAEILFPSRDEIRAMTLANLAAIAAAEASK